MTCLCADCGGLLPADERQVYFALLGAQVYACCSHECWLHWLDDSQEGALLKEAMGE